MTDVQALLDEREITRGLSRFARILDNKQWDELSEGFAQDLRLHYGAGGEQQGIVALCANMTQFMDICGPAQHLIGSVLVNVNGDEALSRAHCGTEEYRGDDREDFEWHESLRRMSG